MRSNPSIMISVSEKNQRVKYILKDLEQRSINKSGFVCQAIIEKYDRMFNKGDEFISSSPFVDNIDVIKQIIRDVLQENQEVKNVVKIKKDKIENHQEEYKDEPIIKKSDAQEVVSSILEDAIGENDKEKEQLLNQMLMDMD